MLFVFKFIVSIIKVSYLKIYKSVFMLLYMNFIILFFLVYNSIYV